MILRILVLASLMMADISACASEQPLALEQAQSKVRQAWQANRHVVWEMEWPAAPLGSPVIVENWQANGRYRFEILESTAPALVGQTLVFNGQTAWRYNRFESGVALQPAPPRLSPVSDAFALIDRLITTPPATATRQESAPLSHGPAQKITLTYANNDWLSVWLDQETGLPARILFSVGGKQATLQARRLEMLPAPPKGLFEPTKSSIIQP